MIAEVSIKGALHDSIEMEEIIEEAIHFDHIGMVDEQLNLELPH